MPDIVTLQEVGIDRLLAQERAHRRRELIPEPHRVARDRAELAKDGRLLDEVDTEGHRGPVAKQVGGTKLLLLEQVGLLFDRRVVETLVVMEQTG